MLDRFFVGQVVQFNENHKWCGCLGIVEEVKPIGPDCKYMIDVPMPDGSSAYIFVMHSDHVIEYVGNAVLGVVKSE